MFGLHSFCLQAELCFDGRCLIERCLKFTDVEVGDNEITEDECGRFCLAAELDHLIHEDLVTADFAGLELVECGQRCQWFRQFCARYA